MDEDPEDKIFLIHEFHFSLKPLYLSILRIASCYSITIVSKDSLFIFLQDLAFEAKGCTNHAEPNTIHLFAEDIFGRRNPLCNAEDNTKAQLIIIKDRFRGY